MKIRMGFVTNSSSTSYLVVGVPDEDVIQKIREAVAAADGKEFNHGVYEDRHEYDAMDKAGLVLLFHPYDYEPFVVGYNAEKLLETMSVQQIREKFVADMKERFGIDVPPEKVYLDYGADYDG